MRKILFLGTVGSICMLVMPCFANGIQNTPPSLIKSDTAIYSGPYIGFQVGYAQALYKKSWLIRKSNTNITSIDSVDDKDYAGIAYLGYDFNRFLALEAGYIGIQQTQFENIKLVSPDKIINDSFNHNITYLAAKGTIPLGTKFSLFAKGGATWVYRRPFSDDTIDIDVKENYYTPMVSLGAKFNFTPQAYADISCTGVMKIDDFPGVYFCGIGAGYRWPM